jgi:hypothetical protein
MRKFRNRLPSRLSFKNNEFFCIKNKIFSDILLTTSDFIDILWDFQP